MIQYAVVKLKGDAHKYLVAMTTGNVQEVWQKGSLHLGGNGVDAQ